VKPDKPTLLVPPDKACLLQLRDTHYHRNNWTQNGFYTRE
jgi:hypothetical protein